MTAVMADGFGNVNGRRFMVTAVTADLPGFDEHLSCDGL